MVLLSSNLEIFRNTPFHPFLPIFDPFPTFDQILTQFWPDFDPILTRLWPVSYEIFSYMSLGVRNVDDGDIDKMMAEAPGALNFTTFLNMLAEKLHGTDSEDVILEGNLFTTRIITANFGKNRWKWPKSEKVGYEV